MTAPAPQRAAIEWLDGMADMHTAPTDWRPHARTILAMLAEPRMPEEPTGEALVIMRCAIDARPLDGTCEVERAYHALREHLSKPKTKTVQVWNVEYNWSVDAGQTWQPAIELYTSEEAARRFAREPGHGAVVHRDVRVTGPHAREVPV